MQIHIVQKGDTLWKISRSYNVSFDELKKMNAHLANPEYIVPGMKIFIPDTKKAAPVSHPYSENPRPVKQQMIQEEEMKIQPQPERNKSMPAVQLPQQMQPPKTQQMQPVQQTPSVPKAQPVQPVKAQPKAQPAQPIKALPKAQPVQQAPVPQPMPPVQPVQQTPPPMPVPQMPMQPIQQVQPIQSFTMPFHIMPAPDVDTPSPQGWRLIESTSIHINIHNDMGEKEHEKPAPKVEPIAEVKPTPLPIQPYESPMMMEEPSPMYTDLYPCDCHQQHHPFPAMHPQMHHQMNPQMFPPMHSQMQPQMHPQMHQQMMPFGDHPCYVCYVPVCHCPPYPYHHF